MVKVPPLAPLIIIFPSSMMIGASYLNDQIESSPTRGVTSWTHNPNKVIKPETNSGRPSQHDELNQFKTICFNNLF
jgi:hypothetical protein